MAHSVVFSSEANSDLLAPYRYLAKPAGMATATAFTDDIVAHCESLATLPERGRRRDDIRSGLRIIGFRRRVSIAFTLADAVIMILGVFYAGRDLAAILRGDQG